MLLTGYLREPRLPCSLNQITTKIERRKLNIKEGDKIGLSKNIIAIPLLDGYILCTKGAVYFIDEIESLRFINGSHTYSELIAMPNFIKSLEQLHNHDLLSVNRSSGNLKVVAINPSYISAYKNADYVNFSMVPLAVELNLTNQCNFNCIHCSKSAQGEKAPGELSTDKILNVIDECIAAGVPELRFMGGEPLLHPGFYKFISHARDNGIYQLKLSTNAWLIDEVKAKELSKYFDSIQISVHGASASVHDFIVRRQGAWEQAKKATKLLQDFGVDVNIGFTVMHENIDDLQKMISVALDWGVKSLGYLCLVSQGRGAELNCWAKHEVHEIGHLIQQLEISAQPQLKLDVAGFPPLHPIRKDAIVYGCEAGKSLMTVEPNGCIKACGILNEMPNLKISEKPLLEIWHSPQFIAMRRRQPCCDCNYTSICWGPCLFLETKG